MMVGTDRRNGWSGVGEKRTTPQHELPLGTLPPFLQGLMGSILSRRDWLALSLPLMHNVMGEA